jgi:hypothetical protein
MTRPRPAAPAPKTAPADHLGPAATPDAPDTQAGGADLSRGTALALAALLLLAYLAFPSRTFGLDSAWYAYEARYYEDPFHPHHLLYNSLGWVLNRAVNAVVAVDTLAVLTAANGLFTATLILVLYRLLRRLQVSAYAACGFALLCGFSAGIWSMATSVEVYPLTVLLQITALWRLSRPLTRTTSALVGGLVGLAMLFHQTGVFFAPAVAYLLYALPQPQLEGGASSPVAEASRYTRLLRPGIALAVAFVVVAVPYALVAASRGLRTPQDVVHWVLSYTDTPQYRAGIWGGGFSLSRLPMVAVGFFSALFSPLVIETWLGSGTRPPLPELGSLLPIVIFAGLMFYTVAACLRVRRHPMAPGTRPAATTQPWTRALLLWLLLHGLFTTWWEPSNPEFWLLLYPALTVLLALVTRPYFAALPSAPRLLLGLCALACLGNFVSRIYPASRPENNPALSVMAALSAERQAGRPVRLILGTLFELSTYTKYYWGRGAEVRTLSLSGQALGPGGDHENVVNAYQAAVAAEVKAGGVYLLETEHTPTALQLAWPPHYTRGDYTKAYAPFMRRARLSGTYVLSGKRWRVFALGE